MNKFYESTESIPLSILETYKLRGFIIHKGSKQHGHYIAMVNNGEGWFYCDDEKIHPINDVTPYLAQSFIAFYDQ